MASASPYLTDFTASTSFDGLWYWLLGDGGIIGYCVNWCQWWPLGVFFVLFLLACLCRLLSMVSSGGWWHYRLCCLIVNGLIFGVCMGFYRGESGDDGFRLTISYWLCSLHLLWWCFIMIMGAGYVVAWLVIVGVDISGGCFGCLLFSSFVLVFAYC